MKNTTQIIKEKYVYLDFQAQKRYKFLSFDPYIDSCFRSISFQSNQCCLILIAQFYYIYDILLDIILGLFDQKNELFF